MNDRPIFPRSESRKNWAGDPREALPRGSRSGEARGLSLRLGIAGGIFSLLVLCAVGHAQSSPKTKKEAAWTAFLWLDGELPLSPETFARLKSLGIAGTNVAGTAPSEAQGEARAPFYLDHLAGKGDLYLRDEDWNPHYRAYAKDRDPRHLRRPRSLADPTVRERMLRRMAEVVAKLGPRRPRAASLDDEISLQRRGNAFDFDRHPLLIEAWRKALLQDRPLASLKQRWRRRALPDDPAKLAPPTTDEVRLRELAGDLRDWNLADWNDWRRFQDAHFVGVVADLTARARELMPAVPIGFTGGGAPNPFSGLDWYALAQHCNFFEPYDEAGTHELVRSFAKPDAAIMRTIFPDRDHPLRTRHELWEYALRGDRGAILWSSRGFFPEDDVAKPAAFVAEIAPTMRTLASPQLETFLRSERETAKIAILESRHSMRAHWMLDSRGDGGNWLRRFGSYEVQNGSFNRTREAWQKLLEDLHLPYVHIDSRQLEQGLIDENIEALILPRTIAISEAERVAITKFARDKLVIADCQLGLLDEELIAYPIPPLDLVFGVNRESRRVALTDARSTAPIYPDRPGILIAEPGLRVLRAKGASARARVGLDLDGVPSLIEVRHEEGGLAVYLNLLVLDYIADSARAKTESSRHPRLDQERRHDLREHLRAIMRRRGIVPPVRVEGSSPFPIRVFARRLGNRRFVALHANPRTTTVPSLNIDDAKPVSLRLWFESPVVVRDVLSRDEALRAKNTARWHHDVRLAPDLPVILEWQDGDVRNR
jgi:hypothetical protein